MPCRDYESDYEIAERKRERRLAKVAYLYDYAYRALGRTPSRQLAKDAMKERLQTDYSAQLCKLCESLTEDQQTLILYNGREKASRDLAQWWEDHQEADKQRKEDEKRNKRIRLRQVVEKTINDWDEDRLERLINALGGI